MSGKIFLVVGNSGTGKDSLISELCTHPNVCTVNRYITRPAHLSEDFISVSDDEFEKLVVQNAFFLNWQSYGLKYGVPMEAVKLADEGFIVLINVSRQVVGSVDAQVIEVKAPEEIVKKRIINRNRESEKGVLARLNRAVEMKNFSEADFVVDNSKELSYAVEQLKTIIFSKS
jgi:ribose 1,5-bisphosphokinase